MNCHYRRYFISSLIIFSVASGFIGCKNNRIEKGKSIKINYTLTVDGEVVDSSSGRPPLEYVQGSGQIIPGLEEQLVGLKPGDKKKVTVTPEKGYGKLDPEATQKIPKAMFGDTKNLKVGMVVTGSNGGRPVRAKVVAIGAKEITLDFNHPLAGKTLNFDIEVVEVTKAPAAKTAAPAAPAAPAPEAPVPPK